jgi:hypothetical protein
LPTLQTKILQTHRSKKLQQSKIPEISRCAPILQFCSVLGPEHMTVYPPSQRMLKPRLQQSIAMDGWKFLASKVVSIMNYGSTQIDVGKQRIVAQTICYKRTEPFLAGIRIAFS